MRATDWNAYYSRPYKTATVTRRITQGRLIRILEDAQRRQGSPLNLIELGGANSCFYDAIQDQVRPRSYSILDNNPLGLQKFRERIASCTGRILEADVLGYQGSPEFDAVFSVGLIEHFSLEDTRRSVLTHWHLVRPGGVMILFFPTPTWLYRITRWFSEALGLWIFHDERPLRPSEVSGALPADAELVHQSTIWPIFLTQSILVARKTPCP